MAGLKYSNLHNYHHADYALAVEHIHRQLGDLTTIKLHRRQVMLAVYVRPLYGGMTDIIISEQTQGEDVVQGKSALVVAVGPAAFGAMDTPEYRAAVYGSEEFVPKVGDWVMVNAASGDPVSYCGSGAEIVTAEDRHGDKQVVYHWKTGWPCRIVEDDSIIATILNPHEVV